MIIGNSKSFHFGPQSTFKLKPTSFGGTARRHRTGLCLRKEAIFYMKEGVCYVVKKEFWSMHLVLLYPWPDGSRKDLLVARCVVKQPGRDYVKTYFVQTVHKSKGTRAHTHRELI